jgi:hypothetical protein
MAGASPPIFSKSMLIIGIPEKTKARCAFSISGLETLVSDYPQSPADTCAT